MGGGQTSRSEIVSPDLGVASVGVSWKEWLWQDQVALLNEILDAVVGECLL